MIVSESSFRGLIFKQCMARAQQAANLWELKIKSGEMPETPAFRRAKMAVEKLAHTHPNIIAARVVQYTEEADEAYFAIEEAFTNNYGWLRAQHMLPRAMH